MKWDELKDKTELFDDSTPEVGHQERFEDKLNQAFGQSNTPYFKWLRVAATIIVIMGGVWFLVKPTPETQKFAESVEKTAFPLQEAEYYYENSVQQQFKMLAMESTTPESHQMIEDAKTMIEALDLDYKKLQNELQLTGDQRIAAAMINNYKSRIKILETLITKIKYVNQLKKETNENTSI